MLKLLIQGYKKLSEIFCQPQSTFWHPKKNKKWQFFIPKKVKLFKSGIARWFSRFFYPPASLISCLQFWKTLKLCKDFKLSTINCMHTISFLFINILVIAISIWKFVRPFRWLLFKRLINPVIRSGSGIECFLLSNHSTDVDGPPN